MSKFYGKIGYFVTEETKPGVYKQTIVEREYFGDIVRNATRRLDTQNQEVNDDIRVTGDISIVADPFAYEHFTNIKYVEFMNAKWTVSNVEVSYPRLILSLGGLCNGKK